MAKIRFKIAVVVLVGCRIFQGMYLGCGVVSTRCATVMRVVCWCRSGGAVSRAMFVWLEAIWWLRRLAIVVFFWV